MSASASLHALTSSWLQNDRPSISQTSTSAQIFLLQIIAERRFDWICAQSDYRQASRFVAVPAKERTVGEPSHESVTQVTGLGQPIRYSL